MSLDSFVVTCSFFIPYNHILGFRTLYFFAILSLKHVISNWPWMKLCHSTGRIFLEKCYVYKWVPLQRCRWQSLHRSLSPSQEVFSGEMDGGNPSLPSTTSLVPLSHKAVPSGHAVITHFTALILITANVNIRIININAQNNAVICNYLVALIFFFHSFPPFVSLFFSSPSSSPHFNVIMGSSYFELI